MIIPSNETLEMKVHILTKESNRILNIKKKLLFWALFSLLLLAAVRVSDQENITVRFPMSFSPLGLSEFPSVYLGIFIFSSQYSLFKL